MNWIDQCMRNFLMSNLSYLFYNSLDKFQISHALHGKVAFLTRRCSDYGTRSCDQRLFWNGFEPSYTKIWLNYEIEIRLACYRSFSTFSKCCHFYMRYLCKQMTWNLSFLLSVNKTFECKGYQIYSTMIFKPAGLSTQIFIHTYEITLI